MARSGGVLYHRAEQLTLPPAQAGIVNHDRAPSIGSLMLYIALFVLIGTPLIALIWDALNLVMAGYFDPLRVGLSIPAVIVFIILARLLSRQVVRWQEHRTEP
jgi:hypothetical protein